MRYLDIDLVDSKRHSLVVCVLKITAFWNELTIDNVKNVNQNFLNDKYKNNDLVLLIYIF